MKVFLSLEAAEQLTQLLGYLESRWSEKVHNNFLDKLDRAVSTISKMPFAFPESVKYPGIRKCVVTSHTSLYYCMHGDAVEILSVIDNRQNL